MTPEQDEFRRRALRAALMVAGIAVVLGLVVGGLTAGAIYVSGVVPEAEPTPTPSLTDAGSDDEDSLPSPSLSPTATPSPTASPSTSASKTPAASPTPQATRSRPPGRARPIRLNAGASSVATFERVTLAGSYPGGNGTSLQVQRREGGSWAPFPTSATVSGGTFSTYVASGQPGPNAFRVVDPATGRSSNVVTVTVS